MDRIRYAVIGLGWFGEKHCEVIVDLPNAELYALCSRTPARLQAVANRFGVKNAYTDYSALLANPAVDAVSITTNWEQHAAPTLAALQAGKHVFLEKPMASTLEECQAIVDAAYQAPGHFMVGHICRFNPRYAAAKAAIDEGRIGQILFLSSRRNLPRWVVTDILNQVSPLMSDGTHEADLMLWFTGAKVVTAYAQTLNVTGKKYPDIGSTLYRFDSGAIGVVETVWYLPDKTAFQIDERMEIIGTEGAISIQDTHPNFSITDKEGWRSADTTYWPVLHGVRSGALREELFYFVDGIQRGQPPSVIRPEEAMAAVEACLAAEQSATTGQIVQLNH